MNEVFISYSHQSKTIADNIVSHLESKKVRCWYAPRDVIGDYATSIVNAINESKIFIVILNEMASNSPHVLNEVEIAYKKVLTNDITILPFKADNHDLSLAMEYYIKRLHWIDASNQNLQNAIEELTTKVLTILGKTTQDTGAQKMIRKDNDYYLNHSSFDLKEARRLKVQSSIIQMFDQGVYEKAISGQSNLSVLDVGSNDGTSIMDRLGNKNEVTKIIGIERDEEAIKRGQEKFKNTKIDFVHLDLCDEKLESKLADYFEPEQLKFDIIVFSFILLHLKNQYQVAKQIVRYLKPNGTIIISDVDDDLITAYPDEKKIFETFFSIRKKSEFGGFRHNGRTINSLLRRLGCKHVSLEKVGLTPLGLDHEHREGFYDMCFSYVFDDTKLLVDKYPLDQELQDEYKWLLENQEEIEQTFMDDDFYYLDSIMIFVGKR